MPSGIYKRTDYHIKKMKQGLSSVSHKEKIRKKYRFVKSPHIDPNSIQATLYPEIANTCCHLVRHKNKPCNNRKLTRKKWKEKYGELKKLQFLCHKCDQIYGVCVNLDHVFVGSPKENIQDMIKKGRLSPLTGKHGKYKRNLRKFENSI
jgi:hypothetical protein